MSEPYPSTGDDDAQDCSDDVINEVLPINVKGESHDFET